MHIENKVSYGMPTVRQYDVETAIALSIDAGDQNERQVDNVRDTVDNAAAVIGRLVAVLVDKGLLDAEDVQHLLGGNFVVVED